jgi:tight adherence protein C
MPDIFVAFFVLLAAATFIVGHLCFFAHDISATRRRLSHRVDPFAHGRRTLARARGEPATQSSNTTHPLRTTTLHGDQLELARFLGPLHIAATLIPWLFLSLRLLLGSALAISLIMLVYRHSGLAAIPSLIGLGFVGAALGWFVSHLVMDRLALNRRRSIAHGLPDAIELLVIAVEAGLSLEDAIKRIVIELSRSQPAIAEELAITSADLSILPSRDDALRRLAVRINLPSLRSVVTTLLQTMRYGTPLAQALRIVAAELRNDALRKLEEQANRMPVLLTIPMILFILPSLFLIILGPAFLKVLDVFGKWN